jgi:zinc/manganese transport system ATP-binding protein
MTATSDSVLAVRSASLTLANHTLWSGLDLDVRGGEFLAVLGANGSGKTTLLRAGARPAAADPWLYHCVRAPG